MSQKNVEIVRRFYPRSTDLVLTIADPRGFEATRQAFEPFVHPDFESVTDPDLVLLSAPGDETHGDSSSQVFHGLDGFASVFRDWLSAWESWLVTPTDFIDVDEDRVLVLFEVRARSKTHQVEITIDSANLWTLRDGKAERLELFLKPATALEAAGLSE